MGGYYLQFRAIALRPVQAAAIVEETVAHDPKAGSRNGTGTRPALPLRGLGANGIPAVKAKDLPASPFAQQPRRPASAAGRTSADGARLRRQTAE
ncbi:MAG: hypothetical protein EXR43_00755 [Dehalococcoidia bacterium]|nr:hypothetical protein [Dehalococcoidia bacterium]